MATPVHLPTSLQGSVKRYVTPERGGRVANFVMNRYGN